MSSRNRSGRALPMRYRLSDLQLGAALALAGIRPGRLSPLPDLPPPAQSASFLRGSPILNDSGQGLTPEGETAIRVLAAPHRLLSVAVNRVGRPDWQEALFFGGEEPGPHVAFAKKGDGFDLALMPVPAQAAVLIDDLFGFTALPAGPGGESVRLDLAGYAAALAAADLAQATRLRERLARSGPLPAPPLTPQALQTPLAQGLHGTDTRWAVTAARAVCPADLAAAADKLADGIVSLQRAGLAVAAPGGAALTPAGHRLAGALGQLLSAGEITLSVAGAGAPFRVARVTVFRSSLSIWLGIWASAGAALTVDLLEVSAAGAFRLVGGLLDSTCLPPSLPRAVSLSGAAPVGD